MIYAFLTASILCNVYLYKVCKERKAQLHMDGLTLTALKIFFLNADRVSLERVFGEYAVRHTSEELMAQYMSIDIEKEADITGNT